MQPRVLLAAVLLQFALPLHAQTPAASRGELLYTTHCIGCHTNAGALA